MAVLVTKTEVLRNETLLEKFLSSIAPQNISVFLQSISSAATQASLSEQQVTTIKKTLLATQLSGLQVEFSTYTTEEWTVLFQDYLFNLTAYFNQSLLEFIPMNVSCSSYQVIVKVFSNQFSSMTDETREAIYQYFLKPYLTAKASTSAVVCDAGSFQNWREVNFGVFFYFFQLGEILTLNENFTPDEVGPADMAVLVTKTEVLRNETLLEKFLSSIAPQNISVFLQSISSAATQASLSEQQVTTIKTTLLATQLSGLQVEFSTYTTEEWTVLFQDYLFNLTAYFNKSLLEFIPMNVSCSSYQVIVKVFSNQFSSMTDETREAIYQYFLKPYLTAKASTSAVVCDAGSFQNWREVNFGIFFYFFQLGEILTLNENFTPDEVGPADMAVLVTKTEVLRNETLLEKFLSSIAPQNISVFLQSISSAATQASLSEQQVTTIKKTLLATQLSGLQVEFSTYTTEEWTVLFQDYLFNLTAYFNQSLLEFIPMNVSCSSYQVIVKVFSNQFSSMTDETREAIYQYFLKPYLTAKASTSAVVCDAGSFQNWREVNFGVFFYFFQLGEILTLNENFTPDEVGPADMAVLVTKTEVLRNETLLEKFLSSIAPQNISVFLQSISSAATQASLSEQQVTTIKKTLLATQLSGLQVEFSTYTTEEWTVLFQDYLFNLTAYFNQSLLEFIPMNVSCSSYQVIVKVFSNQFSSMTDETREAIYQYFLKPYLTAKASTSAVVCDAGSFQNWREVNFGVFFYFFQLGEILTLNENFTPDEVGPADMAVLVTKTEVLRNETLLEKFLSSIAPQNISVFLQSISSAATQASLSEQQVTTIKKTLLATQLSGLQVEFSTYTTEEWTVLFQDYLFNLTAYFNQSLLEFIPMNVSCSSYQVIVKVFSNQFSSMTDETREAIYQYFLKPYLTAKASTSAVVCDAGSFQNWREVNFGVFFYFFQLGEILTLNENFTPDEVGPADMAVLVTKTEVLRNETLLEKFLSSIAPQNISVFLQSISSAATQASLSEQQVTTIKKTLLATQLSGLQVEFSTYTTEEWTVLFQDYLFNLTAYFNQSLLEFIPMNVSCSSYQVIVKVFSNQFSSMTDETREAIYQYFLKPYLTAKASTSAVVCDAGSFQNWREVNFGVFFYFFQLGEILTLNENFTPDEVGPADMAVLVTKTEVLRNETLLEKFLSSIAPQNISVFLQSISSAATQASLSEQQVTTIKKTLLATQLSGLQVEFSTYTTEEWTVLFQDYLFNLTAYFNQSLLEFIPMNVSCSSYQVIVKVFSNQFSSMTDETREAIYQYFLKPYLTAKASTSAVVCDAGSFQNWREVNFGVFFYFFQLGEILTLNENFTPDEVGPADMAVLVTKTEVLRNETLLEKFLSSIAPQNISVFLQSISSAATQASLSEQQVTTIKKTLLATQLSGLQVEFSTYTTEEWTVLFQDYLFNLTAYFNQSLLEFIPMNVSCSSYQVIVKVFSNQFSSMTDETREAIYQYFLKPYLTAKASTSAVVCDAGSFQNWREVNFGVFFYFFQLGEILTLNENFTPDEVGPADMAVLVTKTEVLRNETLLEKFLSSIAPQNISVFLQSISSAATQASLSEQQVTTIKKTLLATQLSGLQVEFSTYTTEEWTVLFQDYLFNLTAYFNQSLLEFIPMNVSCSSYQVIVKVFSNQFSSMTDETREAIYQYFLKPYLTAKASTSAVVCDAGSFQNWREVNFGVFFYFFQLGEILTLNENFTPDEVGPADMAVLVTKTEVLRNETLLEKFLSSIAPQNISVFLQSISSAATQASLSEQQVTTIKKTLLATQLSGLQVEFSTYTTEEWTVLFQDYLFNLTAYFNQSLLEFIPMNVSCSSYQVIVKVFSNQFSSMTDETREAIYQYFLKPYLTAKASTSAVVCDAGSFQNWREVNFGVFFYFFQLGEILTLNENFTPDEVGPADMAVLVTKTEVLRNETLLEKFLSSIAPQNISVFLQSISSAATQASLSEQQVTTIKKTLLATQLSGLQVEFSTYTTEEWTVLFQDYLFNLTAYFNQSLLEFIPMNVSCSSYQVIVKVFSNQFSSMTDETREAIYQYFLKPYLTAKASTSAVVCDAGSFQNWREVNFGIFFYFFQLGEILTLNENFTPDEVGPADMAVLVTKTEVLRNETLLEKFLSSIAPQNISVFLQSISSAATQASLSEQQVTTIKKTLLATQLSGLQVEFSTYTTEEWTVLFQDYLFNLTAYFNKSLLEFIPMNVSCSSYQVIVKVFSIQFSSMTDETREAIYQYFLKPYLTAKASTSAVVCDAGSFQNWREVNFGVFFYFFQLGEILTLNENFTPDEVGPADMAVLVTKTEVLRNETLLEKFLSSIAPQNISVFLQSISSAATQASLSEQQVTTIKKTLLATQLSGLQVEFSTYTTEEWTVLFQDYLFNLTAYFNKSLLEFIPMNVSCSSYQVIVKVFSIQFSSMTDETREAIYQYFLKPYLTAKASTSAVVCDAGSFQNWREVNFGVFFYFFQLGEILTLNENFTPDEVGPADMAVLVTKTEVLRNETLLEKFLSSIAPQNISVFLQSISSAATQASLSEQQVTTIKTTLLATQLSGLQVEFSTYTTEEWTVLFQDYLFNLTAYFNKSLLEFIPMNVSCSSYQVIVKVFSIQFSSMTDETREAIYQYFLKPYLTAKASTSAVVCDAGSFQNWREVNFGVFFYFFQLGEILTLNENFTPDEVGPADMAALVTKTEVLLNETLLEKFLSSIAPQNISVFLQSISSAATQASLSEQQVTTIKKTLLATQLSGLQVEFSTYTTGEWTVLFQDYLFNLTAYFNKSLLEFIPLNVSCSSYQVIVKVFSIQFSSMTDETREAIYQYFLKPYLTAKASTSAVVCDAGSFQNWREVNFGVFFYFFQLGEILTLNEKFTLDKVDPADMAVLVTKPEVLLNETLLETFLSSIAPQNISVFLQSISSAATQASLSDQQVTTIKTTLLATQLRGLQTNFSTYTTEKWTVLFQDYLINLTVFFNQTLFEFIPLDISCSSYQAIVKVFSLQFISLTSSTNELIYRYFLMPYLTAKTATSTDLNPRCYTTGDYSWIVQYLQTFVTYCTSADLQSFSSNETLLQQFSVDSKTLAFIGNLTLQKDFKIYYAQLLSMENSGFSVQMLPENILCFAVGQLNLGNLSPAQAMSTLQSLKSCGPNVNLGQADLAGLLSSVTTITSGTLASLGSLAVGLSPSVLENADGNVLKENLQSLSTVTSWSVTQASVIVSKIVQSNFQVNVDALNKLGTLVVGLPSAELNKLQPSDIMNLATNANFISYVEEAPVALKQKFVLKVIQASIISDKTIFQLVPSTLASAIPASRLLVSNLDISVINQMKWTSSQAQVFFHTVIINVHDFSILSVNILQGFTCGASKILTNDQFTSLIKSMNGKAVKLEGSQVSCMAKRLTKVGASNDFSSIPSNVLLFTSPVTSKSQCKDYFTRVGQANIDLLPQGSTKRTSLLSNAISCLNINTNSITKENLVTLGNLACDLTGKEIIGCDSYVLEALKNCSSFTTDQRAAIVTRLKAKYGNPSTWTLSTMTMIGRLSSTLDRATVMLISKTVKIKFFPSLLSSLKTTYKTTFTFVLSQLAVSSRITRDVFVSCNEELTIDMINNQMDLIAATYSAAQLDACITNKTLIDSLTVLGSLAFADEQLQVLKARLDMIFSNGVPEQYLIQLGNIARMYSEEEISLWNITSVDTLATLIQSASWNSNDIKVNELVQRYLQLNYPNASLDGTLLTVLAPYICSLNETLIQNLSYENLGNSSQPLEISTCSQTIKNLLFDKMKLVYSSYDNSSNEYYQIMMPVIGGARASDLIAFARGFPEMDLTTFTSLNPEEVKELSVQNIMDLLGDSVLEINTIFSSSVLIAWAEANNQSEINNTTAYLQSIIAALVTNADVLLNDDLLKTYLNMIAPQNVPIFLQSITSAAIQANLSEEQVTTIKKTLLATELRGLQANFSTYTTEQWSVLFQNDLLNLTVYFNQTLLEIIPLNVTCSSYQAIVKAFSLQFSSMTDDTREAIYQNFLKPYLTAKIAISTVVCDAGNFQDWSELNFGAFFYFFSLEEIMTLNKNFTLNDLSPMDIAYSVTTANILLNATLLEKYLSAIAPQNVTVFLEAFSSTAKQANLSEEQVTTIKKTLLATELRGLQANFSTYTTEQWSVLFQNDLLNLTVYFNQSLLELIPLNLSCSSYQAIVKAFSLQFSSMTDDTREAIYQNFLKPYLKAKIAISTVVCDAGNIQDWRELNFGAFFYFFSLEEIMTLNKNFTLNDLSPMDIAYSVTTANILLNATLVEKYLSAIAPQNVTVFLEAFSSTAKQANLSEEQVTTIKKTLLVSELRGLQANFSTYTTEQWSVLFQNYLLNLTVYFNQTLLEIIPLNVTCSSYQAIVKAFSLQFSSMTDDTREAIYQNFLKPYLKAKIAISTVVCDAGNFQDWSELNFGAFFYFFSLEEIMTLNKNFTMNDLSPMDIAYSVTTANILLNATLLEKYLSAIAPQNVTVFLEAFSSTAKQANLSVEQVTTIKKTLLVTELRGLQANFSTYTTEQWSVLFQNDLLNLTVYFNQTLLEIIPLNVTCSSYQAIVQAFSLQFSSMTDDTREAIYQNFLKPYLKAKIAISTVVCDAGNFQDWSELNFGAFFYFFSLEEIMTLNKNFTLNDLSPMDIAYSVTTANILLNATLLEKYLSAIAPQNVTVFLEAFSSTAKQANLSEEQVTTIKKTLLVTELRGLQANFSTYTTEQWSVLFQNDLLNLTVYFNQTLLEIIPLNVTCSSYQAIVKAFSLQFSSMTDDTREAIYQNFLKPYLKAKIAISTVVCDAGNFQDWSELNFGAFFYFFSLEEIMTLNKNFTMVSSCTWVDITNPRLMMKRCKRSIKKGYHDIGWCNAIGFCHQRESHTPFLYHKGDS
ncbi:uncharacterized protein LOC120944381 [Rana temporaria]|uniref:uncharacterized protein LOC120944381 n=1 Tax=Rana temporaria TaxID=8407 RepID=UPI001AAC63E8|nr:uncharacterized protein LOC120944381 [Rana temporaria]